jgi:hypothetical protein
MGPIGLHGGGEFRAGDEPFLRALLEAAGPAVEERRRACAPAPADRSEWADGATLRVVILPTAAARQRPALAIETGIRAFRGVAAGAGAAIRVDGLPIVDRTSAETSQWAGRITGADIVYFTGGDPDVIPSVFPGTLADRALLAARARGAVVAGASAGAMALASWTWTAAGGVAGLGLVRGLVVVPHFGQQDAATWRARLTADDGPGSLGSLGHGGPLGLLGLDERTGIISGPDANPGIDTAWRVAGPGRCHWYPPSGGDPVVAGGGEIVRLIARS